MSGVKRLGRDADRSPPSSVDGRNEWSYTSWRGDRQIYFYVYLYSLIRININYNARRFWSPETEFPTYVTPLIFVQSPTRLLPNTKYFISVPDEDKVVL